MLDEICLADPAHASYANGFCHDSILGSGQISHIADKAGSAPLSVLRATHVDDAPPIIGADVGSRGCAPLRLAPRVSAGRPSVLLLPRSGWPAFAPLRHHLLKFGSLHPRASQGAAPAGIRPHQRLVLLAHPIHFSIDV